MAHGARILSLVAEWAKSSTKMYNMDEHVEARRPGKLNYKPQSERETATTRTVGIAICMRAGCF